MPVTLEEFNERILRPTVLRGIRSGQFDGVLLDPDVLGALSGDPEIEKAVLERIKIIAYQQLASSGTSSEVPE